MRIYLSNYWRKSLTFGVIIIFTLVIATIIFCAWSHDDEDYILVICSIFYISVFFYLTAISTKLARYVAKENNQFVMYSLGGKKLSSLNYESDVYYEILPLVEGMYSTRNYIVISNFSFVSYRKRRVTGLSKICKLIDENGNQIIMPYSEQASILPDNSRWHEIN